MTHHAVCHDCTFEKLTKGALVAEEALEDHSEATGHDVEQQFVGFERASRFVTDGGLVATCPECDRASVGCNNPGNARSSTETTLYFCHACKARFDEPLEREPKREGHIRGDTLAAALDAADPDDLRADGGQEIVPECIYVYNRPDTDFLSYTRSYEIAYQDVTGYPSGEPHDWDDDHEKTPDIRAWSWAVGR